MMQALLMQTIKEYMTRRGDNKTKEIVFCSSFSLRNLPSCEEEASVHNSFVPMTFNLPVTESLNQAVAATKETTKSLLGGRFLIASKHLVDLSVSLPFGLSRNAIEFFTSPITFSYSSMPAPKRPFTFDG